MASSEGERRGLIRETAKASDAKLLLRAFLPIIAAGILALGIVLSLYLFDIEPPYLTLARVLVVGLAAACLVIFRQELLIRSLSRRILSVEEKLGIHPKPVEKKRPPLLRLIHEFSQWRQTQIERHKEELT